MTLSVDLLSFEVVLFFFLLTTSTSRSGRFLISVLLWMPLTRREMLLRPQFSYCSNPSLKRGSSSNCSLAFSWSSSVGTHEKKELRLGGTRGDEVELEEDAGGRRGVDDDIVFEVAFF